MNIRYPIYEGVYRILTVLFLLSGTLVSLIFRTFTFILKTILVLIAMGMLV